MAVLLIGSTGNGKSTLGNFLFDPSSSPKEIFEVASDNLPKTRKCEAVTHHVKYYDDQSPTLMKKVSMFVMGGKSGSLTVIDTPGLNEDRERDLKNMIRLVATMKKQQVFKACIFVLKYTAKIDQQYKDTIKYYSTLLPDLFSHNCLIVLTDYATDKRSEEMRKKKNEDYDTIVENVKDEIMKSSGICFTPIIFTIDCVPVGPDEVKQSKRVRDAMLSYIFSLREVRMTEFLVAKTKILQSEDREKIEGYKGEIKGYNERLKKINQSATMALDDLQSTEDNITGIKDKLNGYEERLRNKDSDELVVAHVWSIDDARKLPSWHEKSFDETSIYEVHDVEKWVSDYCHWKEFLQTGNRVHGAVKADFNCRLYASITMKTEKRARYAKAIEELRKDIKLTKIKLHQATVAARKCKEEHSEFESEMSDLSKYIKEKGELIEVLSKDMMTLEEAIDRLEKK